MSATSTLEGTPRIIDLNFQGVPGVIGSFLLQRDGELGLIETGPTTSLSNLVAGLEPYGGLDRLTSVVITHVHLDHAGGVGQLLARATAAKCYVHSTGARHLIDPSRLLRSAGRIYGDQMDTLWGEVIAAPEDQVVSVEDGDVISIGGIDLKVVYTPGHAVHHIILFHEPTRSVYTGDAAGVLLPGQTEVRPAAPPPDLDPDVWKQSIQRIRDLDAQTMYLTHYGPVSEGLDRHFDNLIENLDGWIEFVREAHENGADPQTIAADMQVNGDREVREAGGDETTIRQYALASPYGMTVDGIIRYLEHGVPGGSSPSSATHR